MKEKFYKKAKILLLTAMAIFGCVGVSKMATQASVSVTAGAIIPNTAAKMTQGYYSAWWGGGINRIYVNGLDAFCIEPTVVGLTGPYGIGNMNDSLKEKLSLIAYYGWDNSPKTGNDYATTQYMMWEAIGASIEWHGSFGSEYSSRKAALQAKIDKHDTLPSFNGNTITVSEGETIRITDTNGVLGQMTLPDNYDGQVKIEGNDLVITANGSLENFTLDVNKIGNDYVGTSIVYHSASGTGQDVGVFKVKNQVTSTVTIQVEPDDVSLELTKTSSKPEYTNGNPAYDLTGAQYQVYTDSAAKNPAKTVDGENAILTVKDNSGVTNQVVLKSGTYYVKEIKAANSGYLINNNISQAIKVEGDTTVNYKLTGNMAEPVMNDPIAIMVQKGVNGTDSSGKPMGDITDFGGAQFRISYYTGFYDNVADAQASGAPTMSAVWETDDEGYLIFINMSPVSGEWEYQQYGFNTVPLGTVTVTEEKGIPGTVIDPSSKFGNTLHIKDQNGKPHVEVVEAWDGATPEGVASGFANKAMYGGLTIVKADNELNQSTPQGDATLAGVKYDIINNSKAPIVIDGKETAVGDVAMTITTVYNSTTRRYEATTGSKVLPFGTYEVREVKASIGYDNAGWSKTFEIRNDGQMVSYTNQASEWNENDVLRYGVEVGKIDRDKHAYSPSGDADLSGAVFQIKNESANAVIVDGKTIQPGGIVGTMSAVAEEQADGSTKYVARSTNNWLPYGKYSVTEIQAPNGYLLDDTSKAWKQVFSVGYKAEGAVASTTVANTYASLTNEDLAASNLVKKGGIILVKADSELDASTPQGDASLLNVKYDIYNESKSSVVVNGHTAAPGEVVMTINTVYNETTKRYEATTGNNVLPYGTYEIREVKASEGYNNNAWTQRFEIRENSQMISYTNTAEGWNENDVLRYGVVVGKIDRDTNSYNPQGGASLAGAVFQIKNESANAVIVDNKLVQPGAVVGNITTQAEVQDDGSTKYVARSTTDWLPYGKYSVTEIKAPNGYLLDDEAKAWTRTFSVGYNADGVDASTTTVNTYADLTGTDKAAANIVKRSDFNFKKKFADNDNEVGANIAWTITSKTTGETHVIVTDANGIWGSAFNEHTNNTNANDPDSINSNGAIEIIDGHYTVVDSSKLDSTAGTWFTGFAPELVEWTDSTTYTFGGNTVKVDDSQRALPYDVYTLTELESDANEGYYPMSVTVTLHGNNIDIDYGTLNNKPVPQPEILTELFYVDGKNDELKSIPAGKDVILTDLITYTELNAREAYTVKGELHLVSTEVNAEGETVYVDGGVVATGERSFTSSASGNGEIEVIFPAFDTSDLQGKSLVAFEYLYNKDGKLVAEHADLSDSYQTVVIPSIGTTLTGDDEHEANATDEIIELIDKVEYTNLMPGKQYTLTGELHERDADGNDAGVVLDVDGNPVTSTMTFVPTEPNGTVDIAFRFKADVAGKTLVAFEEVSYNDVVFATHADINDEGQTVTFPKVETTATDKVDGGDDIYAGKDQVIVDEVRLSNLVVGKEYTVSGTLHTKSIDAAGNVVDNGVYMVDGEPYVVSKTFTADAKDVTIELEFTIDASALAGQDVVVFEYLHRGDIILGTHTDINDENQTVHVAKLKTTLLDAATGTHMVDALGVDGKIKLVDTIAYENLIIGEEYTVKGSLRVRNEKDGEITDGGAFEVDGKEVVATATFTPEATSGTVDVTFEFDAKDLAGKSLVAFEEVYNANAKLIASHKDITDASQTINFVSVKTTAHDATTGNSMVSAESEVYTIIDTVEYTGLTVGKQYTMKGSMHVQEEVVGEDGKVTIQDAGILKDISGNEVVASTTFIPETPNGTVDVTFTFEAENLAGHTLVVFEDLMLEDTKLTSHADIEDEYQSVHVLKVGTLATAANGKDKEVTASTNTEIIDYVSYENLEPGQEYVIHGQLMQVNADGEVSIAKDKYGNEVLEEVKFTPETADGQVEVKFTVDTSKLGDGKLVAFEKVFTAEMHLIGLHEDIDDEGQTVKVIKPTEPDVNVDIETGVNNMALPVAMGMLSLLIGAGALLVWRKSKSQA